MAETLATDTEITELITALQESGSDDLEQIDRLLHRYPEDPRLHFMRGSVLAVTSRPIEAHTAMSKAVAIAPEFRIARYQLGFFELTSGEVARALSTWGPLLALPDDDYLRVFVEGMTHLIRDEFGETIERFQRGMSLNQDNEPLNSDIRLLIGEIRKLAEKRIEQPGDSDSELSATSLILGQFSTNRTIN